MRHSPQVRQSGHCSSLPSDEASFIMTQTLISSQTRTEPLLKQKKSLMPIVLLRRAVAECLKERCAIAEYVLFQQ